MESSATESRKEMYKHVKGIAHLGNPCSLKEVSLTEKPLITGRILRKLPTVKKSRYQMQDVLVIQLREIYYSLDKNEALQFKVIFVGDAVQLVENLWIEEGDLLAFCEVKLFPIVTFKPNSPFFSKQIIVGLQQSNNIANVWYKRKNMGEWCQLNINLSLDKSIVHFESIPEEPASNNRFDNSSNEHAIPSTSRNFQVIPPRIDDNEIISSISGSSDVTVDRIENSEKANANRPIEVSEPRNVLCEFGKNYLAQEISRNRNEKSTDIKGYQYVKLAQLKKNSRANVYGVVRGTVNKFHSNYKQKWQLFLNIIDDSTTEEFSVTIYAGDSDQFPDILPNYIIRFHRLLVEEYNNRITGKVFNFRDVLVFNKDDINITYSTAKKFTLTDSDKNKAEELKQWALKNLTDFRLFTSLSSLELKAGEINLSGKVSNVKIFKDHAVVALRIRDGTKCTVPFLRLRLDLDTWEKVLIDSKPFKLESEEIDIAINQPHGNFESLKIGNQIELFDVKVTTGTEYIKANATEYLKFHLVGNSNNLKLVSSKKNFVKESFKHHPTIASRSTCHRDVVKKRRLFDPDETIQFENDDFDKNQDKSTNTNDLFDNCEISNQTTDMDIQRNNLISDNTLRKEIEVSNTHSLPQHALIENAVSHMENHVVSCNGSGKNENYLLKWPQPKAEDTFNIKVDLISTSPAIDETCKEEDVLFLVKLYCDTCDEFTHYPSANWHEVNGVGIPFCKKCEAQGYLKESGCELMFKMYLLDQCNEPMPAVIIGDYARRFLGCESNDIISSKETRMRIRDLLISYSYRAGKEKKPLIASIYTIFRKNEFQHHIMELKPYGSFTT